MKGVLLKLLEYAGETVQLNSATETAPFFKCRFFSLSVFYASTSPSKQTWTAGEKIICVLAFGSQGLLRECGRTPSGSSQHMDTGIMEVYRIQKQTLWTFKECGSSPNGIFRILKQIFWKFVGYGHRPCGSFKDMDTDLVEVLRIWTQTLWTFASVCHCTKTDGQIWTGGPCVRQVVH